MALQFIQGHGEFNRTMEKAILATLSYSDIFDYPLTEEEIWKWLVLEDGKQKTENKEKFLHSLKFALNSRQIRVTKGFYHLPRREEIVKIRQQRETYSKLKIKLAEKVAGILRLIPWVKLIGVTGALAMNNSKEDDDLDLLIITSKNRLWLTRLFSVFLVELTGKRRRPGDQKVKDKICLNMLLDESHLAIPEKERDLFSAHEVCQMKPLWEKERTYQKFLKANQWSQEFLPNWKP
jgi:D-beta-D-heptose 7-phosphate kinase/D-beta-D-heptose 1-phosphate adenosyltransferase